MMTARSFNATTGAAAETPKRKFCFVVIRMPTVKMNALIHTNYTSLGFNRRVRPAEVKPASGADVAVNHKLIAPVFDQNRTCSNLIIIINTEHVRERARLPERCGELPVRRLQTVKHMTSPPRASDPREERASERARASGPSWALPLSQSDPQHQSRAPPTDAKGDAGQVVTHAFSSYCKKAGIQYTVSERYSH